jgi:hypothetical protein
MSKRKMPGFSPSIYSPTKDGWTSVSSLMSAFIIKAEL